MKCPKCGYTTFPYVENCSKCGRSLVDARELYGVYALPPTPPDLTLAAELVHTETADVAPDTAPMDIIAPPTIDLNQLDEIELEVTTAGEPSLEVSESSEQPQVTEEDRRLRNLDNRFGAGDVVQPFELDLTDEEAEFHLIPVEEDIPWSDETPEEETGHILEITDAHEREVLGLEPLDEDDGDGLADEDEADDDR